MAPKEKRVDTERREEIIAIAREVVKQQNENKKSSSNPNTTINRTLLTCLLAVAAVIGKFAWDGNAHLAKINEQMNNFLTSQNEMKGDVKEMQGRLRILELRSRFDSAGDPQ